MWFTSVEDEFRLGRGYWGGIHGNGIGIRFASGHTACNRLGIYPGPMAACVNSMPAAFAGDPKGRLARIVRPDGSQTRPGSGVMAFDYRKIGEGGGGGGGGGARARGSRAQVCSRPFGGSKLADWQSQRCTILCVVRGPLPGSRFRQGFRLISGAFPLGAGHVFRIRPRGDAGPGRGRSAFRTPYAERAGRRSRNRGAVPGSRTGHGFHSPAWAFADPAAVGAPGPAVPGRGGEVAGAAGKPFSRCSSTAGMARN